MTPIPACSVAGCAKPRWAKGYCTLHYHRVRRLGHTGSVAADTARQHLSHGLAGHPLHVKWTAMLDRCHNPAHREYARYGAVGIVVAPRWHDLHAFVADVAGDYRPGLWLGRHDVTLPYGPANHRWVTPAEAQHSRALMGHYRACEPRLRALRQSPLTQQQIALILGVRIGWVRQRWAASSPMPPPVRRDNPALIRRMAEAGHSSAEIMAETGLSARTVYDHAGPIMHARRRAARDARMAEVMRRTAEGERPRHIAEAMGCTRQDIYDLRYRYLQLTK